MSYPPPPVPYGQTPAPHYPLERPAVYTWFIVYAAGMALLYALCIAVGAFLAFGPVRTSAASADERTLLLVQGVKRLLGWDVWPDDFVAEWTAADQAQYNAGERVDRHVGRWRKCDWPGEAAARGSLFEERWRRGAGCGRTRAAAC